MKGKPKSITISQDGVKWYCFVLCEYTVPDKAKEYDNVVGCDVDLKKFATKICKYN